MSSRIRQILDTYNVIWTTPSNHSGDSMPCGGGDVGVNVWVENGDLLLYLARSGTFDELNRLPKLGRLRITLEPNPFLDSDVFRQELKLFEGHVQIAARRGDLSVTVNVWVDVGAPVAHVEVETSGPTSLDVAFECWRTEDRIFTKAELHAARSWAGAPDSGTVHADRVSFRDDSIDFIHENRGRSAFDVCVEQQGLASVRDTLWNPLEGLVFGGSVTGSNLAHNGTDQGRYAGTPFVAHRLRSRSPALGHHVRAVLSVDPIEEDPEARPKSLAWWKAFWCRSFISIRPDVPDADDPRWQLGRNYQLFRYQLACNARGEWPTKFNGGLFTFDPQFVDEKKTLDPDYRQWGGGTFTAQNQRLVYWPMLKCGDVEMMRPAFDFYLNNLRNAERRAKQYWDIDGACFTEQIECFGLPCAYEYGWKRPADAEPGIEHNAWVSYQWDTVFEFCLMILDAHAYSVSSPPSFDLQTYLPVIESCLSFYDAFYRDRCKRLTGLELDENGKLRIDPGTACETYKNAVNPSSTLAALRVVLLRLIELPDDTLPSKERWRAMLATIPDIALREVDGHTTIAPAWKWSHKQNCELPQLYPVWPYSLFALGKPGLDIAINTWRYGIDAPDQKQIISWHQDAIFCARLGLTEEAAALTIEKLRDAPRRFPTFWGPGHDWVPDHNWGGSGMIGLQEMLLQCIDDKLWLLPAWPKDWDVEFKLHAPGRTIVECSYRGGVIDVRVTPEARIRDLVYP